MKRLVLGVAAVLVAGAAGAQVGVSIGLHEPGVYGRIDFGSPPPRVALVAPQPILVMPPRMAPPPPVYLYVPAPQQRDWRRYCRRYDACGRPVYFVRDDWVRERYVQAHPDWRDPRRGGPPPRGPRPDRGGHGPDGHGHGHGRGHGHEGPRGPGGPGGPDPRGGGPGHGPGRG